MKNFLVAVLFFLPVVASAYDVEIDGIYYDVVSKAKVAEVTFGENKYSGDIVIPATIEYEGVVCSVKSIGSGAFTDCSGLTSLTLSEGIETIKSGALQVVRNLKSVTIPTSLTTIENWNFTYVEGMNVYITDLKAWCHMTSHSNLLIGGGHLYVNNTEISDLVLSGDYEWIGNFAFSGCASVKSVTIEEGVRVIGIAAFDGCPQLASISFPASIESIKSSAFGHCPEITHVSLPHVIELGDYVFGECEKLQSVILPSDLTEITMGMFMGCTSLKDLSFLENILTIGEDAFHGCTGLQTINLPQGVVYIGDIAFYGCSEVITLSLPSTIRNIQSQAFADCKKLKDVYCYAENVPQTEENAFDGSYVEYTTLHIPETSISDYQQSTPWSHFESIVAFSGTTPDKQKCETPTITYSDGKLHFSCDTEEAECVATITDPDIATHYGQEISLSATYVVNVYATASGYENSDIATATLCWIDAEPRTEGMTNDISMARGNAILVQSNNGMLNISGAERGTDIEIYTMAGIKVASAKASNVSTSIATNLQSGETVIIRVGKQSLKFLLR